MVNHFFNIYIFGTPQANPNRVDKQPYWGYIGHMDKDNALQVVVETSEFIKQAQRCMDDISRKGFIDYIAANPKAGDIIVNTGGARKIRWSGDNHRGKRGGVRIIYYYHDISMPIFLFTTYGKNAKANLSKAERNGLGAIIKQIVTTYEG